MQNSPDVSQAVFLVGIIVSNFGLIIGSWISLRVATAELKVKVDRLEKDIDNIGAILGTEKSKGRIL